MQSKPLTLPTISQQRAAHQQSFQQYECTMIMLNNTAAVAVTVEKRHYAAHSYVEVFLTVTGTFLTPPYMFRGKKQFAKQLLFVGVTLVHQMCMRCSNTTGAE